MNTNKHRKLALGLMYGISAGIIVLTTVDRLSLNIVFAQKEVYAAAIFIAVILGGAATIFDFITNRRPTIGKTTFKSGAKKMLPTVLGLLVSIDLLLGVCQKLEITKIPNGIYLLLSLLVSALFFFWAVSSRPPTRKKENPNKNH